MKKIKNKSNHDITFILEPYGREYTVKPGDYFYFEDDWNIVEMAAEDNIITIHLEIQKVNQMYLRLDALPTQVVLDNLQHGLQVVITVNMENLLDDYTVSGDPTAETVGHELIDLLKINGKLINAIDLELHIKSIKEIVNSKLDGE